MLILGCLCSSDADELNEGRAKWRGDGGGREGEERGKGQEGKVK